MITLMTLIITTEGEVTQLQRSPSYIAYVPSHVGSAWHRAIRPLFVIPGLKVTLVTLISLDKKLLIALDNMYIYMYVCRL